MVKRVLSGAAEKRTPRWSIDPGNKANLGETRTAEVERFEKAPATTFPHGPAAVELPPNCHGGGPRNQRWRLTARLHESGRPGSNRRRPAWEAVGACKQDVGPLLGFRGLLAVCVPRGALAC